MTEEEKTMWAKTNEVALEAIRNKEFGEELRRKASEMVTSGQCKCKYDAIDCLLKEIVAEREKAAKQGE